MSKDSSIFAVPQVPRVSADQVSIDRLDLELTDLGEYCAAEHQLAGFRTVADVQHWVQESVGADQSMMSVGVLASSAERELITVADIEVPDIFLEPMFSIDHEASADHQVEVRGAVATGSLPAVNTAAEALLSEYHLVVISHAGLGISLVLPVDDTVLQVSRNDAASYYAVSARSATQYADNEEAQVLHRVRWRNWYDTAYELSVQEHALGEARIEAVPKYVHEIAAGMRADGHNCQWNQTPCSAFAGGLTSHVCSEAAELTSAYCKRHYVLTLAYIEEVAQR